MTQRISIYARYSSDLQSASSIEDQSRLCEQRAAQEGWQTTGTYTDAAVSGASMMRPGIQSLIQGALSGAFDIVLCEALDRLSRNLSDIAALFQQLEFAGVRIITLTEGEIGTMHIGLKGTMNALFLKDLADKTRRGLRGKVEKGLSGGGISYGYEVAGKGERKINEAQSLIIRRIFQEYAHDNKSPKAIAAQLNAENIPSPSGGNWSQSTINGNRQRGTGILNNDLYQGRLVWNRQKFIKDPNTGKRVSRYNPPEAWITQDVPELRIIEDGLWQAVKMRQKALDKKPSRLNAKKRPQYLLSGLLTCGNCGGGYSKINSERYGCSNARNKGESICSNKRSIKRETLEDAVLGALEIHLMRDELIKEFCAEYTKHMNSLIATQNAARSQYKAELSKCAKEKQNIIQAIKDGMPATMLKDELEKIGTREQELEAMIERYDEPPRPLLHPTMANRYRQEIAALKESFASGSGGEAREHLRSLIEKITLTPKADEDDGLQVDLYGDLAGILTMATYNEKRLERMAINDNRSFKPSVKLVAGAGFEPTTFGL